MLKPMIHDRKKHLHNSKNTSFSNIIHCRHFRADLFKYFYYG